MTITLALALLVPVFQDDPANDDVLLHAPWETASGFTGDWGGLRTDLAEDGIAIEGMVFLESSTVVSGGIDEDTSTRAVWLAGAAFDLDRLAGLPRTTAYVQGYAIRGSNAYEDTGDFQYFSFIDAPPKTQVSELWIEHTTEDGALRGKFGKFDATNEFGQVTVGFDFLHSSAVLPASTVLFLPTYPNPAVAAAAFWQVDERLELKLGLFDARDDGVPVSGRKVFNAEFDAVYAVGEGVWSWDDWTGLGEGRATLGLWRHTGDQLADLSGAGLDQGTSGLYTIVEQRLRSLDEDGPGLLAFLQAGIGDDGTNPVENHFGFGLHAEGLIPGHETWTSGLYVSRVGFSDSTITGLSGSETAVEAFQRVRLTRNVTLVPALTWIADPSGSSTIDDAFVMTFRAEIVL